MKPSLDLASHREDIRPGVSPTATISKTGGPGILINPNGKGKDGISRTGVYLVGN